jgi:hypothetical protein
MKYLMRIIGIAIAVAQPGAADSRSSATRPIEPSSGEPVSAMEAAWAFFPVPLASGRDRMPAKDEVLHAKYEKKKSKKTATVTRRIEPPSGEPAADAPDPRCAQLTAAQRAQMDGCR